MATIMHMAGHGSLWPHWSAWHLSEEGVIVAALGLSMLLVTWARLSSRQRNLWSIALAATVLLLSSDVQATSMSNYPSHMVEHLLVILVIAPLVAAALRLPLSRSASTMGFVAFTVLVPLFHLTALGGWVMQYSGGHDVELAVFLLVGVWFWLPVYGEGSPFADSQRVTYGVLALPVIATTGLVLWSSTTSSLHSVGMSMAGVTIGDVRDGGVVMMVLGTALMVTHVLVLWLQSLAHQRAHRVPVGLKYA